MMKVVFDNNVVLDALRPNPDFEADAKNLLRLIGYNKISPYICANSLTDIFYVLQKIQGAEAAKKLIINLITVFDIIPLTKNDCIEALSLPINDFEDAIIAVCAKKIIADCIVSRDEKFIKSKIDVKIVTPKWLLKKII